jgi:NAD(P)-dependent dehydrogenase (short-subunit alcohol dehydrogenase family)
VAPALSPVAAELGDAFAGVIVCAAISPYGPLETTPLAGARKTLEINTISDLAIYQACLPHLRQTKGRLVFLSSFGGKLALPFIGHYVTSKFALEGLCDVMRREAARFGVPVIVIEPGGIKTTMVTNQLASIVKDIATLSPEQAALYGDRYREFHGMLAGAPETANEPDLIAGIVVDAFEDPTPQARYTAGPDAAELVALARRSTDAELDAFLEQMYGASAAG